MNNYYYPAGADNSLAPWNETPIDEETIDINVWQTMSIKDRISINPYDDDMVGEWKEQCHSIPYLLSILKEYLSKEISTLDEKSPKAKRLKALIMSCDDWEEVETEIEKA